MMIVDTAIIAGQLRYQIIDVIYMFFSI